METACPQKEPGEEALASSPGSRQFSRFCQLLAAGPPSFDPVRPPKKLLCQLDLLLDLIAEILVTVLATLLLNLRDLLFQIVATELVHRIDDSEDNALDIAINRGPICPF